MQKAAAAWVAVGGLPAAMAQQRSNIVQLTGDAMINGVPLSPQQSIQTGAVASVWGKGVDRSIVLPTLTAGIRGTDVYAEIFAVQGDRNYFCNCYGTVDVGAEPQR